MLLVAALPVLAAAQENAFRTNWQPHLQAATADEAVNVTRPTHCKLAVVGAGWGGAYLAWRLAVDTTTVNASDVCVFEANGRVGGRIFSVHGLPNFADITVDVGGYRFQESQKLPADLVWKALELPTTCYDWKCAQACEGVTCYVIKDAYGNNAGYATAIEAMLAKLEAMGAGTQVHFGMRLTKITPAPSVSATASALTFADGTVVTADRTVLNMPRNAIEHLDQTSLLFSSAATPANVSTLLGNVETFGMNKVYAWYEDAWWSTKLGKMEGYFNSHGKPTKTKPVPLEGRYHDGPQRCVVGTDTAGEPVYSGFKVPYGNCSGALEVFYGRAMPYYQALMPSPLQPLTVATHDGSVGGVLGQTLIADVHQTLMEHHALQLRAKGVDPASIKPPLTVVLSNWIADGLYTPGIGHVFTDGWPSADAAKAALRKPSAEYDVFVVDQDYGYQSGWAVGSLIMAEKILQAELGIAKPSWLDDDWYTQNVLAHL